jgi:hypothetical protein
LVFGSAWGKRSIFGSLMCPNIELREIVLSKNPHFDGMIYFAML